MYIQNVGADDRVPRTSTPEQKVNVRVLGCREGRPTVFAKGQRGFAAQRNRQTGSVRRQSDERRQTVFSPGLPTDRGRVWGSGVRDAGQVCTGK